MLAFLSSERKQNNSSNPIRIRKFLFLSYSFEIETINTFIHFRSSLENHTRFQTKTAQKPDPMERQYLYSLYRGEPPPPPPLRVWKADVLKRRTTCNSAFKFRVAFLRMWYFQILFLNFQHPLFLRDPFMSLLKLRTFGYTSPHGAGCSNPKNIGWMNNICNSLHVVSVFPFLF